MSLANVALILHGERKLDDSARMFKQSLAMLRRMHGDATDHVNIAGVLGNLAAVLSDQGNNAAALQMFRCVHVCVRVRVRRWLAQLTM
jgi:hypothetical protein